jgi:CRP/FNR family cyclic AMP-dependent transcriptional regulator
VTSRWRPPRSFLDRLTADERAEILALGVTRPLRAGTRLLVENARDTHVEILRQGYAKVTRSAGGVPRLMGIRLPGDILGEFGAVTGHGRQATVTACDKVVSTVIQQADFLHFLARRPHVANEVTATVGERLEWANTRRSEFAAYPVHVRLARVLGDIAAGFDTAAAGPLDTAGHEVRIGLSLSQAELATLVGAAEDTVQRALRLLRERGLIGTGYRRIVVRDLKALLAMAEETD